ncbi:type I endonuclease-methyltransferase fusion protein [Clostridia bacterium]|nr:type I endonuclease-methyltransferase fusion protein [Clostridia bacterium]
MFGYLSSIESVIERLGYSDARNLIRKDGFAGAATLSMHTRKVLEDIEPYAVYIVDDKPFIAFFGGMTESEFKVTSKKVWNAQIPVIVFCKEEIVQIFNGLSIDPSSRLLIKLDSDLQVENCNEQTPFSFWRITDINFWNDYSKSYSQKRLNRSLLENITYITEKLKYEYHVSFATKLVLRTIFICYLIDRGVDLDYAGFSCDAGQSRTEFHDLLRSREKTYELFAHLKWKFNGNLFDLGDELLDENLTEEVFSLLARFLEGKENVKIGQFSLFELYDFSIIPIELISNIYEILLGKKKQDDDNAFYTPEYLVDYILGRTISPYLLKHDVCTVLDPACGSGIFLVGTYRFVVEKKLCSDSYTSDDAMLKNTLMDCIYGIDKNEEAVDVAIFSLYLTVLDYKDPKTLNQFTLPNLKGTNLLVSDFFDEGALTELQKNIHFDFIIGNPPWGANKEPKHLSYCSKYGYDKMQQDYEIERGFVFRARDFCKEDTQCCFVVHSTFMYSQKTPSALYRNYLLTTARIREIVEMSSVRKLVFLNADAPAAIIAFQYSAESCLENTIRYISIKPNIFYKLFNIIVIEKNDVKYIKQSLLVQYDWAWKVIVYGFSGDFDNVKLVKEKYPTIRQILPQQNPELLEGVGVTYTEGSKDTQVLVDLKIPLLDSRGSIDHFYLDKEKQIPFTRKKIHRLGKDIRLFQPPYCLIIKGLDTSNYTMRSVYEEEGFIFKDGIIIIKGDFEQKNILLNLTGLINSSFFAYLQLMLGSSVGIEREQRFKQGLLQFPYVYGDVIAKMTERIQNLKKEAKTGVLYDVNVEVELENISNDLNQYIFDGFGLSNNVFVDYALNIQIPQLTNASETKIYRAVNDDELRIYTKCFDEHFSSVYEKSGKYTEIILYPDILSRYTAFELKILDFEPAEKLRVLRSADNTKKMLSKISEYKINDMFYQFREVVYFEESSFFIIKPNYYKNWHPAIAQLDLADVVDKILLSAESIPI